MAAKKRTKHKAEHMNATKIGADVGIGMMALGALGRITGKGTPRRDPMGAYLNEGFGSLIVFGAALTFVSVAFMGEDQGVSPQ